MAPTCWMKNITLFVRSTSPWAMLNGFSTEISRSTLQKPIPQRAPWPAIAIIRAAMVLRLRMGSLNNSPMAPISFPRDACSSFACVHFSGSFTERRIQNTRSAGMAPTA
jgi:hypothetical protein